MSTRLSRLSKFPLRALVSAASRAGLPAAGACALAALALPAVRADATTPVSAKAGPATAPAEAQAKAARFVQSYARASEDKSIIRWRNQICIEVVGLQPEQDAAVKSRIEAVAQAQRLWLYSTRHLCGKATNVSVVFTQNAQSTLDGIIARNPLNLGDQHSDTRTVKTVTRPIQAWYQMSLCGDVCGPTPIQEHIGAAMVLVDMRRAGNTKLATIADYVTMLVLSEPRYPDHCQALPSVLDLFVGPCQGRPAPTGLTRTDLAYLKAVYSADEPIWRPTFSRSRAAPPTLDQVAARMGQLMAGAGTLPAPGPAPVPNR